MACGKEMNLEEETPIKEMAFMLFVQENTFQAKVDKLVKHITEQETTQIKLFEEINLEFQRIKDAEKEQELLLQSEFDDINNELKQQKELLQKEISDNHSRFKRIKARK